MLRKSVIAGPARRGRSFCVRCASLLMGPSQVKTTGPRLGPAPWHDIGATTQFPSLAWRDTRSRGGFPLGASAAAASYRRRAEKRAAAAARAAFPEILSFAYTFERCRS